MSDIYQAGNALFRDLRCFLEFAGLDPSTCRIVIQMPNHEARAAVAKSLQAAAAPASPNSAARAGSFCGVWQGVTYEFGVRKSADSLKDYVASLDHVPINPDATKAYEESWEKLWPKIEADLKASARAAHFARLGIPDPLAKDEERHG